MCTRKENGDDVPLGAPYPHPRNVSDGGKNDTSSMPRALSIEELNVLCNAYLSIIERQKGIIDEQAKTIKRQEKTIDQQHETINLQHETIRLLQSSIENGIATIDVKTKKIDELERSIDTLDYSATAKAEFQPTPANIEYIRRQLKSYLSQDKNEQERIGNRLALMMKDKKLAVIGSQGAQGEWLIVVTAQYMREFISALFDMMNSEKRHEFTSRQSGAASRMARYLIERIKKRRGDRGNLVDIGINSLRETIRRAANQYITEHDYSATF